MRLIAQELSAAEMGDRLATIDRGRKVGDRAAVPLSVGEDGSPSNTMLPWLRSISFLSGILIHPTVWPQYTNVTDRQDRQRSDSIGRTVLQTVARNLSYNQMNELHRSCPVDVIGGCWLLLNIMLLLSLFHVAR